MAPRSQPKRGRGYAPALPPNINEWLLDAEAKSRFEAMSRSTILPGAFVKYEDLSSYRIQELANASGLHSLLSYADNNLEINHLLVKLFYANMGLGQVPHRREECIWTTVCGIRIFLPLQRLGAILSCPWEGTKLDEVEVDMDPNARDQISHQFLNDDIQMLRSVNLRPQARILHRAMIRSVTPRSGSYEEVRKENFQALYGIYGGLNINWASWILRDIMYVNRRRKYKTFHHGSYIMRILRFFKVPAIDSETSRISEIGKRTLGLMGLEKHPQSLAHISYQEWVANRDQNRAQPRAQAPRRRRQGHEIEEEEGEEDRVEVISPESTIKEALITLSRNQSKLEDRQLKSEAKHERRFNSIRKFLSKMHAAMSCSGASSSSQAIPPAPFQWSSSGNNNGDDDEEEEEEGEDSNEESSET